MTTAAATDDRATRLDVIRAEREAVPQLMLDVEARIGFGEHPEHIEAALVENGADPAHVKKAVEIVLDELDTALLTEIETGAESEITSQEANRRAGVARRKKASTRKTPHELPTAAPSMQNPIDAAKAGTPYAMTDLGNAERLVAWHRDEIRWDVARKAWRAWDGRRWDLDSALRVHALAAETARKIRKEAAEAPEAIASAI